MQLMHSTSRGSEDELGNVFIYQVTIDCNKGQTIEEMDENVQEYVDKALNGNPEDLTFYKSQIYTSDNGKYVINLYAFTKSCVKPEVEKYLNEELKEMTVESSHVLELKSSMARSPYVPEFDESNAPSCNNIPGNNLFTKFFHWWLIIPKVQVDFFDLLYQLYTFDITHQGFLLKSIHFFTIPCNVMLSMFFLAQFNFVGLDRKYGHGTFEVNLALLLLLVLSLIYMIVGAIRKCWIWGISTSLALTVCWATGNLFYTVYKVPGNPWYNPTSLGANPIMWTYISSFIQTLSHTFADKLPPYITGFNHWETVHMFFCRRYSDSGTQVRSYFFIVIGVICFPVLSVGVSWFSWPHLIGTEVFYIMVGIGYKPDFLKKLLLVIEKTELAGDPLLNHVPKTVEELRHSTYMKKLREFGLVSENPSNGEVIKTVNTVRFAKAYFCQGINKDEHCLMLNVENGLQKHGKPDEKV